jgi:hypothetical protein
MKIEGEKRKEKSGMLTLLSPSIERTLGGRERLRLTEELLNWCEQQRLESNLGMFADENSSKPLNPEERKINK